MTLTEAATRIYLSSADQVLVYYVDYGDWYIYDADVIDLIEVGQPLFVGRSLIGESYQDFLCRLHEEINEEWRSERAC
jgi:hypothetical protein